MPVHIRAADVITSLRLALLPVVWSLALLGHGYLVGIGLLTAGLTDILDGWVARRLGQVSARGARLDMVADILLLFSAAGWIGILHPTVFTENALLLTATFVTYVVSLAAGFIKFGRLGNLHLYSARAAGGLLYVFAVVTLLADDYDERLLVLAAATLTVSSAETLVANLLLGVVDKRLGSVLLRLRRRDETMTTQPAYSAHAPTPNRT